MKKLNEPWFRREQHMILFLGFIVAQCQNMNKFMGLY